MHHIAYGPLAFVVAMSLLVCLSAWNSYRMVKAIPARGRALIAAELARRAETAISIEKIPLKELGVAAGLSSTTAFRVVARAADGEERTYEWAYEPKTFPWQTGGLKRCAHGVWIALT